MAVHDLTDQIRQEKVAERFPPLFKRLPDRLFAPLASANRFQYWSLLCALHAKRFGPEAPLPPSTGFLMREITADIAEELQYQDWAPDGDDVTPATPLAIRAIMVFNRLRDAGWIRVDRLGVREMATMAPAVTHFHEPLSRVRSHRPGICLRQDPQHRSQLEAASGREHRRRLAAGGSSPVTRPT